MSVVTSPPLACFYVTEDVIFLKYGFAHQVQ